MSLPEDAGGRWLQGTDVPTFFLPVAGESVVVVFLRAGEFDEPLPLTGLTEVALRAAIAGLPSGGAVREVRVDGLLSTIVLAGEHSEVRETLRLLATALTEPDEARIHGELQRAKSRVDQRVHGPRELHFAKRFGSRGSGASDLPQYGAFKAGAADIQALAARLFVDGNAALLVLGEEPPQLSFALAPGGRAALPRAFTLDTVKLPARTSGPPGGVSASLELPRSLAGRLTFHLLIARVDAGGTSGDLSAAVEQVSDRDVIGMVAAPVADAFVQEAGAALVHEAAALARSAPSTDELAQARVAWLAETGATPYAFGRFVVSEMLLGQRLQSRADLVDQLWDVEPEDVSLTAELMTATMLLLLPEGVEIEELPELHRLIPPPSGRVKGRRFRPVGAAIDWEASARGSLFVGDEGVSQVTKMGHVFTILFDDVELMIDYDDGVIVFVGSAAWLQVDPRLWKHGETVRSMIFQHVAPDRVVPVPKGERAVVAGERAIEQERKTARRSLTKALAILVGTITFVALLAWWANSRDDAAPLGNCAAVEGGAATRVDCSDAAADARLLAIVSPSAPSSRRECPRRTDDIVPIADTVSDSGCLLRLKPPHPGRPGGGGGILLVRDCIVEPTGGLAQPETRCGSSRHWATVSAITVNPARCPRPAIDYVQRPTSSPRSILCLSGGPGVITPGDCVTDQLVTDLLKVRCGSPEAAFRVVSRTASESRCPARTDTAFVPRALPRAAVACVRRT